MWALECDLCPMAAAARDRDTAHVMSEANIEMVRRSYDAFNQGNVALALEPADPDFEWIPPDQDLSGPVRGREKVQQFIEEQLETYEFEMHPEEFFEKEAQVLAFVHLRGRGNVSGAEFDIRIAQVWTVRNGRLVRGQVYANRDEALEAVGLKG